MDLAEKKSLTGRLLAHLDNGTTDYADSVMEVPFGAFADPELHAREVAMAKRNPHIVAHASELTKAGDFVTADLVGVELLVVRQPDGTVKAFANVCRHRGAKVEWDATGCKRFFRCQYHNWSYGREGSLRGLPHEGDFDGLDKASYGLQEFPCEERWGLVWVVPTVGESIDMAALLGEKHDAELMATGIEKSWQHTSGTWDLEMNWKIVVDGVQDTYHLCQLHTTTVCPLLHGNVHTLDQHGKSWRLVVARKTIEELRDADPAELDVRDYTLANYTVFPGTMMVTEPAHFEIWSITPHPTDPTRSRTTIRLLSPTEPGTDRARRFFDRNWDLLMETLHEEDWKVSKTISDNVASGVDRLVYGRNELPCQLFHTTVAAELEPAASTEGNAR